MTLITSHLTVVSLSTLHWYAGLLNTLGGVKKYAFLRTYLLF